MTTFAKMDSSNLLSCQNPNPKQVMHRTVSELKRKRTATGSAMGVRLVRATSYDFYSLSMKLSRSFREKGGLRESPCSSRVPTCTTIPWLAEVSSSGAPSTPSFCVLWIFASMQHLITQYPAKEQAELRVRVQFPMQFPGSCFNMRGADAEKLY